MAVTRAALCVFLIVGGCGGNDPAPSCVDDVRNGDEAAVDCGGACGATCELGATCRDGRDCLFGTCSDGLCAPPREGPEPTGAVTAAISPQGGQLQLVTDERVRVTLTFPEGALAAATSITATPRTPASRSWLEVELSPPGTILSMPVQMDIELPPPVLESSSGVVAFGASSAEMFLGTQVAGHQLSARSLVLGRPALPEGAAARSVPLVDPGTLLFSLPLPLDLQVDLARQLLAVLRATNRYGDALQLIGIVNTIALRTGDPDFVAKVQPLVDEAYPVACQGLTDAAIQLDSSNPMCPSEHQRFQSRAAIWFGLLMKLEGLVETPGCPAATVPPDGEYSPWQVSSLGSSRRMVANMLDDHGRYLTCECRETPEEEWSGVQRIQCPRLLASAFELPAPMDEGLFVEPGDWDVAVDSIDRAELEVVKTRLLDLDAAADLQNTEVVNPLVTFIRELTYAACKRDRHAENIGKLLRVLPGRMSLIEDAQYCASPLQVQPLDADAMTPAGTATTLGAADRPGPQARSAEIGVAPSGWVRLSGPLAPLRCPEQTASEPDELVAILRANGTSMEIARRSAGAQGLLDPPLDLDVAALRDAAGLTALDATNIRVDLVRETTACGGLYGDAVYTLFELRLTDRKVIHLKFDETSGSVAMDASGNGHHATLVDSASFGVGQCGGSLATGAPNDHAAVPDAPAFDFPGAFTMSAWVNVSVTDENQAIATSLNFTTAGGWSFHLFKGASGLGLRMVIEAGAATADCTVEGGPVSAGTWHHVAVAGAHGAPFTLYLNGVNLGTSAASCSVIPLAAPLRIGMSGGQTVGRIDDFRIYDRTLTATEIAQLAGPTCGL